MMQLTELLTSEQVAEVHEASFVILENVGLLVRNEMARSRFAEGGCRVDTETQTVKFPPRVVEQFREAFPRSFTLHARDPAYDRTLPEDGPLISTASSAPNVIDPATGEERRARSEDIANSAYLANELSGYDVFTIAVTADDAPLDQFYLSRFYPALKNCLKPVQGSAPGRDEADLILRLGALIAGSEGAYRERPFITYLSAPVISPLTMDVDSTEMFMRFAEEGLPTYTVVPPTAGMTSPLTLLGTLAQCNAEFLAQAVLAQMSRPGTPLLYGAIPTIADVRTGAYALGAIETGILMMGCAQMARYYDVPCAGYVGLTNAKVNDAQSGFETALSGMAAVLARVDMLMMGGMLDALMALDFAKIVIDHEIALMLKRVIEGYDFDVEALALDVIAEAGPGGTFMDKEHTYKRMKTATLLPEIADRKPRRDWEDSGRLDADARAMQRVREILGRDNPAVFSSEVDARIRAEFTELVAGDATWPG